MSEEPSGYEHAVADAVAYGRLQENVRYLVEDRAAVVTRLNRMIDERKEDRERVIAMESRIPENLPDVVAEFRQAIRDLDTLRKQIYAVVGAVILALVLAGVKFALSGGLKGMG